MSEEAKKLEQKEERQRKQMIRRAKKAFFLTVGALSYAAAISLFLDPNSLAPGGVSGIAIILSRFVPLETGSLVLLINIPLMLAGGLKFGWKFICSTAYCTVLASLSMNLMGTYGAVTQDPLLAAIAGGGLTALGLGLVFKNGGTTGGMDIIVKFLRLKYPHLKTGSLFLVADSLVVALSAFVFKNIDVALYAGLVVFINSFLLDVVLYGRDGAKLIYIISDKSREIAERLLQELDLGVTYVHAEGAYSGQDKKVIMCVMRKHLSHKAEEIIKEEDPLAFLIVTSATEIYGEGYKSLFGERL